jgi:hypothetical protein
MLRCVSWCVITDVSRNSSVSVFMVVLVQDLHFQQDRLCHLNHPGCVGVVPTHD